jgi:hypothetical protein
MSKRRDFLGFTAGVVVARTVLPIAAKAEEVVNTTTPAGHPDADLLHLAERFIQHERAMQEWPCEALPGTPEDERQYAEQSRMVDIQHSLTLQLGLLRATTSDGIQARARCLAVHNADGAFTMDDPNTTTGRLLRHLMRDAGAELGPTSR